MTPHRALVLLAAAQLTGCFYSYGNPAEDLRAGQIGGTVLADVAGSGTPVARGDVAVSLKGAAFDQATRPNGRFVVLDLPVGQHRLLFRNGTTWALERDVDIAWGSDGQPEGVELGNVVLSYSAAVEGSISLPPGNTIAGGVAVDESSGLTAPLVVVTPAPGNPAPPVTFRFPMLALGTHVIKLFATDTNVVPGKWVGGQVVVSVTPADQGTTITLANVAARAASATGRLRFKVQAIGLSLPPGSVTVNLTPDPGLNPISPASDGSMDVTVPEGLYAIQVVAPATAPPLTHLAPDARFTPLAAAAPVPTVSPAALHGVVLQSRVAEVGSLYVASDTSLMASMTACRDGSDCGGLSCTANTCVGLVPTPPPVTAGTTFCARCLYDGLDQAPGFGAPCQAGPNVAGACACPVGVDCVLRPGDPALKPVASYCAPQACGFACTPDGSNLATFKPATGTCP